MIIVFSLTFVMIIIAIIFGVLTAVVGEAIYGLSENLWIIALIFLVFHIILFIVTYRMKSRDVYDIKRNKIISCSLCAIGDIIRLIIETIILYCMFGGYLLRTHSDGVFNYILGVLGFLLNLIIFILLLMASYGIEFLPAEYNDNMSYLTIGFINIGLSIVFFFLSQFLLGFGAQDDIISTLFENLPILKKVLFFMFAILY